MIRIQKYNSILDVPTEWDTVIGDNLYLSIKFLSFMEKVDKCQQEYFVLFEDEKVSNVFMTYIRPKYNMAMFTKMTLNQKMKMVYVPLSVTRPGIANENHLEAVFEYIKTLKGPKMILNLSNHNPKGFAKGLTCPKCIFTNRFNSFDDYLNSLRSGYRRRYRKALAKSSSLTLEYLDDNKKFNEEMYACYLQVYNKSRVRVEKLPLAFFQGEFFKIFVLKDKDKIVGFGQMVENGDELIFEFVGVDYTYNEKYDTYHRILLEITRYGIENNFKTIDFGQTADESKLKLGSQYTMLYAYLHHTNPVLNFINCRLAKYIEYRPLQTKFNVFKEEEDEDITR